MVIKMFYEIPRISYSNFELKSKLQTAKRTIQRNYQLKNYTVYVIDRFEGSYAVCEDSSNCSIVNIHLRLLPKNVNEGCFLIVLHNNLHLL